MGWRTYEIGSMNELLAAAPAWNDLWQRSATALPTARAECLAIWLEQFAPSARFRALAVEGDGRLQAVLPLVGRRLKRVLPVASLPSNAWGACGDLLVDPAGDAETALDLLADSLNRQPWPLIWLDYLPIESPAWQSLQAALARRGLMAEAHERFRIGQVQIAGDWAAFQASWSRNHRRQMRRFERRLESHGAAGFKIHLHFAPGELESLMRQGFEVEDRNWKGAAGSSVLKSPGMFDYFLRQSRPLAEAGLLRLCSLELAGRMIAFEFGYAAKGVYFPHKIGYDEDYADCSPGQMLLMRHLELLHAEPGHTLLDFAGPLNENTRRWSTAAYPLGRLVICQRRKSSRLLFAAFRAARSRRQRLVPAALDN